MRISIDKSLIDLFPEAVEYIVVLRGCSNMTAKSREIVEYMEFVQKKMRTDKKSYDFENDPRFTKWQLAQEKIFENMRISGTEDNNVGLSSHISLIKKILSEKDLANINPIVNFYNAFSAYHGLPIGAEDLTKVYGDFVFKLANGGEPFVTIASKEIESIKKGDVVLADSLGPTCRGWNQKQSERDKVGKYSTDVMFFFDHLGCKCTKCNSTDGSICSNTNISHSNPLCDCEVCDSTLGQIYDKPIDQISSSGVTGDVSRSTFENASINSSYNPKAAVSKLENNQDAKILYENAKEEKINFDQLLRYFVSKLEYYFGGSYEIYKLDKDNLQVEFGAPNLDDTEVKNLTLQEKHDYLQNIINEIYAKGSKGITKRKADNLCLKNNNSPINLLDSKLLKICQDSGILLGQNSFMLQSQHNIESAEYSTAVAMRVASEMHRSPKEIALQVKEIVSKCSEINSCDVADNGFINLTMSEKFYTSNLVNFQNNFDNITSPVSGENKTILIEMVSPNPNKALHLGHILNLFLGKSLLRIFNKVGFNAVEDCLVNDKGLPIAKTIWAIKKYSNSGTPEKEGLKQDHWVDKYYVIGANEFKESLSVRKEVRAILKSLENEDQEIIETWKQVISHSVEGQRATLKRLGEDFGYLWYEHEIYKIGRNIIESHIDGKNVIQLPDGVVVGLLEKTYGVPDVVLVKSDGTSLYHTQDLALTIKKIEKFSPWKAIWVVGNDQIVHFQRLFSLIDMLSVMPIDNLYHYAYGYVFDKDGKKFSSRTGDALSADELIDIVLEGAKKVILARKAINADSQDSSDINSTAQKSGIAKEKADVEMNKNESEIANIAQKVGLSALKYAFLSTDPYKDIKFDIERSLSFNGKSGPYILYAYVRAKSILDKASINCLDCVDEVVGKLSSLNSIGGKFSLDSNSKDLIKKLLDYPDTIIASANNYMPSIIAEYLFDLAKEFSSFYENTDIIGDQTEAKYYKLVAIFLFCKVISDGLKLLGIETLDRM